MPAAGGVPLPHLAREFIKKTIAGGAGYVGYERDNWYRPLEPVN